MIELLNDGLRFSFPEVHPNAGLRVTFMRTLRIPDNDREWPLPPGLGRFPLRHLDDHADQVPSAWRERGGVMMPMHQSEAMWIRFEVEGDRGQTSYPFAVQIATGKIDAITGKPLQAELKPTPQNYLVAPVQPWLDGFCVEKGIIRQFVAMPLGSGYSAEEQLSGKAEFGGIQIVVRPMVRSEYEKLPKKLDDGWHRSKTLCFMEAKSMGIAPGGRMRQEIYEDPFGLSTWVSQSSRCFVHLCNSTVWRQYTGSNPPQVPVTAKEYEASGLPWFEWYGGDAVALEGGEALKQLKSVAGIAKEKGEGGSDSDESVQIGQVVPLGELPVARRVREGSL